MQRYYLQPPQYDSKTEKLYLAAPAYITKADDTTGIVDAFVSVMGNVDLEDDIIHNGAFTKTIQEKGTDFRVLDNHNFWSIMDALGTCIDIEERPRRDLPKAVQEKFPDATGGLFTSTQFMLDDMHSMAAYRRLKSGAITQYSIGFQIIKQDWTDENFGTEDEPLMRSIRNIREIRLWEYSLVLFAANPATATAGIKQHAFIPVTLDNLKRAETNKSCATCHFFGKFATDVGYCKRHNGTSKTNTICEEYEGDYTLADEFNKRLTDSLDTIFTSMTDVAHLKPSIPAMVDAMSRLLPAETHNTLYESQDTEYNEQSDSTSTEAATQKPLLSKQERLALMKDIETRHETEKRKLQKES